MSPAHLNTKPEPDAKGNFELQGITSGDYTLVARIEPTNAKSKMFWGQRPLHVGNTNLRNADLRFSMKGIIPGDYRVLAFQAVERSSLSDPDFLERFQDRESIHVREGEMVNVSLDAILADESTP